MKLVTTCTLCGGTGVEPGVELLLDDLENAVRGCPVDSICPRCLGLKEILTPDGMEVARATELLQRICRGGIPMELRRARDAVLGRAEFEARRRMQWPPRQWGTKK